MAELLSPGVVMQEVPFGPQPIEGVSTSTAGFVGEALYGPTKGAPVLVTSFADFERKFGGLVPGKHLGYAIRGYFENGGRRAYVMRVVAADAQVGKLDLVRTAQGSSIPVIGGLSPTGTANQYRFTVAHVAGMGPLAPNNTLTLTDRTGVADHVTMTINSVDAATQVVTATGTVATTVPAQPPLAGRSGDRYFVRFGAAGTGTPTVLALSARSHGSYATRLSTFVAPRYAANVPIVARIGLDSASDAVYQLQDVAMLRVGDRVELRRASADKRNALGTIVAIDRGTRRVTLEGDPDAQIADGQLHLITWRIQTYLDGALVETIDVTSDPAQMEVQIEQRSSWVRATTTPTMDAASVGTHPTMTAALPLALGMPSTTPESAAGVDAVVGSTSLRTGIGAFEAQDGVNIIAAPGFHGSVVVNALISQAERLQDRFAIVDADPAKQDTSELLTDRGQYNSSYAAVYHPWLRARDPITGTTIDVPPAGHVAGCFARTDNDRGVFKAPANVVLRGITGLKIDVTTGEQDILNPAGINVLRRFDQLGYVVWGARTMSSDTLWKYVPVRRLFIFLEQSIARGTRYAVFEPNAQPLWMRIRDSVTNFLTTQWRSGALFGESPEQAFFVKVDETTTTQDDRDLGRVNILVGIAPVKPAEFVVFQIGQAPSSVIIAEAS